MPETLNTIEEHQLLDAVKRAVDLTDQGYSPDDAIEKIARDDGYGPGKIRLIAHAYNNGKQLSQWHHGGNILDKLASYQLSDPAKIINRIYGNESITKKAEIIDPDYSLPPSWLKSKELEKRAHVLLPESKLEPYPSDPMEKLHRAYGTIAREKNAADEAGRLASKAKDDVGLNVLRLVNYFKQASYNRIPFEYVEHATNNYFGNASKPLMNLVYKQAKLREKRAGDKIPVISHRLDLKREPFTLIQLAIKSAEQCNELRKIASEKRQKAQQIKEAALRPFSEAEGSMPSIQSKVVSTFSIIDDQAANVFHTKLASGWGSEVAAIAAGDVIGQGVHENLNKEEEIPDDSLDDATAQNEISGIRNRVALDTMLADPKNPLSKYPVTDVVGAYNGLIKAHPKLASKPEVLQPLLEAHFAKNKTITAMDKAAVIDLSTIGAGMAGRTLGNIPKDKDKMIEDAWMKLEDPEHQNELRRIRAHALLTQLLTDPEDPISGHDPDKVLSAYNELSRTSPRVADNIHTLRPVLRRKLEGHQEPFETKELLDIEKGLAQIRLSTPSTNILGDSPNAILG